MKARTKNTTRNTIMCLIFTLLVLFAPFKNCNSQVALQDSLALIDIYEFMGGSQWIHNHNWTQTPLSAHWDGVTVVNHRVVSLMLGFNNLINTLPNSIGNLTGLIILNMTGNNICGTIPESICNLNKLASLNFDFNHLEGVIPECLGSNPDTLTTLDLAHNNFNGTIPDTLLKVYFGSLSLGENDFTQLPPPDQNTTVSGLGVNKNKLQFGDLEPWKIYWAIFPQWTFNYSPQDSVCNAIDTLLPEGSFIDLATVVSGTANHYKWFKNGLVVPGATGAHLIIPSFTSANAGKYTCEVTNTIVTNLTLYRRHVTLGVSSSILIGEVENTGFEITYNSQDNKLSIYTDTRAPQSVSLSLYDVMGRKVMELFNGDTQQQRITYDLRYIKNGSYFIHGVIGRQPVSKRILVN